MATTKHKSKKQLKPKAAKPNAEPKAQQRPRPAPKAEVAPEPAPKQEVTPKRSPLPPMKPTDVITSVQTSWGPCPYREGTKSALNFAKYREGMTVAEALAAGCPRDYIQWDRRYGFITVSPAE